MSNRARIEEVVEDEFNDDTDFPLPPVRALKNTGTRGALLQEIGDDDDDEDEDEESDDEAPELLAPGPPHSGLGRGAVGKAQQSNPLSPDGIDYKKWTCVYPIYIDAKRPYQSTQRRIAREKSVWWPTSYLIAGVVSNLRLSSVHEPAKSHPRDWENPGRVKIQLKMNGRFLNPRVKTKKQLLEAISALIQQANANQVPRATDDTTLQIEPEHTESTDPATTPANRSSSSKPPPKQAPTTKPSKPKPRRTPLRKPPQPHPTLSERLSPRSPLIESGVLLDTLKAAANAQKGVAGPSGKEGATPGVAGGKAKRKIVRVRG